MRLVVSAIVLLMGVFAASSWASSEDTFEVRATAIDSTLYRQGKVERDKSGDEVVYRVDVPSKTITRTAVYNKNLSPDRGGGGLQADGTVYTIVHVGLDPLLGGQHVIKAFGKTGALDGYEILVIGEAFVTTVRSTADYFALYSYKRTDDLAEQFRMQKGN